MAAKTTTGDETPRHYHYIEIEFTRSRLKVLTLIAHQKMTQNLKIA